MIQEPIHGKTTLMNLAAIDVAKVMHLCRPPERALLRSADDGRDGQVDGASAGRDRDVHPAALFQSPAVGSRGFGGIRRTDEWKSPTLCRAGSCLMCAPGGNEFVAAHI